MTTFWKSFRTALLAMTGLGIIACQGDRIPAGIEDAAPSFTEVNGVQLVTVLPGRALQPAGAAVLVSSLQGAVISTVDGSLTVSAGAVATGTSITMEPENNGYIGFRFGPNHLQFLIPATLRISAAKANIASSSKYELKIAGASDSADDWTVIGGTYDPMTDTVTVPISHFSRYALCVE